MKIVVLDGHTLNPGDNPWDDLARLGDLEVHERSSEAEVVERARGADVVLTNKTRLDARAFAALPSLRFVAVLATGHDVVDVVAARRLGVPVSNVPEYGTESVAQHTFALLLELVSAVGLHDEAVKRGEWSRSPDFSFWKRSIVELSGRTLGLVGQGRIGRRVAEIATAFGMRVVSSSRSLGDLESLLERSEVVSLHCPLTKDTRNLVDRAFLARMRSGSFLVNTARGGLVDEAALADALRSGHLAGAAVDVVSAEPIREDNPLLSAPNLIVTPHLAWASLEARRRLMAETVENVRAFLAGHPRNVVNADTHP